MNTIRFFELIDQHLRAIKFIMAPLFLIFVGIVYIFVYMTGGIKFVYSHSMYLPILLSGFVFGVKGGVLIGVIGGADKGSISILEAAVILAHKMGIRAIAEGVENKEVYDFLINIGCDMAQGFLISRPLSASDFAKWYIQCTGRYLHT